MEGEEENAYVLFDLLTLGKEVRIAKSYVIFTGRIAKDSKLELNKNDDLDEEHDSTFPEEKDQVDSEGQFEVEDEDEDVVGLMKSERGKMK